MYRFLFVIAGVVFLLAPALAGPELVPVKGTKYATYDMATGGINPTGDPVRYGDSVWAATQLSGFYIPSAAHGWILWDWGDIAGPQPIGGFGFSYAADSVLLPERLDAVMFFYGEYNGWCGAGSPGATLLAGFRIVNLPGADPGGQWNSWVITVDLDAAGLPFTIDGSDLDGDGLTDFAYSYWFDNYVENNPPYAGYLGPVIAGDPNVIPPTAPGMEDCFDYYYDPTNCGTFCGNPSLPFLQLYMELFESANVPGLYCPQPGGHGWYCTADITPWPNHDCIVNLADLAQLLASYPTASGAAHEDGDVEPEDGNGAWDPWDGDGDVDLADLAQLLGQYGDNCN